VSIPEALRFIRTVREDEALRREIAGLGHAPPLDRLVEIGRRLGQMFDADELTQAFTRDAAIRWVFYQSKADRRSSRPP
jgi:hypothetical protein